MKKYDLHLHSTYSDGKDSINSIIQAAISKGLTRIAITDHASAFGQFLFTFNNPTKPIESYLGEITKLRSKYRGLIEIDAGLEISQDFLNIPKSSVSQDQLQGNLEYFSLFLIESTIIQEPILTAVNMRNYLSSQGFTYVPVILAHPAYSRMDFKTFQKLLINNIGFELNESKLTSRHADYFIDLVNSLTPKERNILKISLGSDAHNIEDIGDMNFVLQIIEQNNLWKYIITPPKMHDFLLV